MPLAVVTVFLLLIAVYPFVEEWITGDRRDHHLLERPRNAPTRTAIGVAAVVFYGTLWVAGSADLIATAFQLTIEQVIAVLQATLVFGPLIGFFLAHRVCLALQKKDREVLLHGYETGRIVRLPGGEYVEVHRPVSESERWRIGVVDAPRPLQLRPDERGRITVVERLRVRLSRFFFEDRIEVGSPLGRVVEAGTAVPGRADAAGGALRARRMPRHPELRSRRMPRRHPELRTKADAAASVDALSSRS